MLGNQSESLPSARSIPQDTQQARSLWLNAFRAAHLFKGHHIAAADGSTALQAATRACDVPSLSGVSHIRHLFTPLSTIPKNWLAAIRTRFAARHEATRVV